MRTGRLLPLALALSLHPGLAGAVTISFSWTGTVTSVAPELASVVTVGDPASGSFWIDGATADTDADPSIGHYPGAASAITFRFGGLEIPASSGDLRINDSIGDGFTLQVPGPGGSVEGFPLESLLFHLETGPGALTGDAIPLELDPADFTGGISNSVVWMRGEGGWLMVSASATSFSYVVPEPGTGALLGLGALLLALYRRR